MCNDRILSDYYKHTYIYAIYNLYVICFYALEHLYDEVEKK